MRGARYDVAIVGAGIVGIAHALAAARRGLRVIVFDRDSRANGASVRNFGFITVTGQPAGLTWKRARRSRDIWEELAPLADIEIVHRNECLIVHSREAVKVLTEFAATDMGADCQLLSPEQLRERVPMANFDDVCGALWSPLELRIEPRAALSGLAAHLGKRYGVRIEWDTQVWQIATHRLDTTAGTFEADRIVVASGPDLLTLFPEVHAKRKVSLCKLQMLRLAPQPSDWKLPAAIMSDFGLVRYGGFSAQPAAAGLRTLLEVEQAQLLSYGIHLIVVQSSDGSLIIGDSHEYGMTLDPFYSSEIEAAILSLAHSVLHMPHGDVVERWIGVYPYSKTCDAFVDSPDPHTRVVEVTSGTGMSTAFGLAEEVIAELFA